MRYVVVDTETGGTNPVRHDLLSVGLVAVDEHGIRAMTDIKVPGAHDRVDRASLEINGIDLQQHNKDSVSREQARKKIENFLRAYVQDQWVLMAGWNVHFDRQFIKQLWYGRDMRGQRIYSHRFDWLFSYRMMDVHSYMALLNAFQDQFVYPTSLDEALNLFGVSLQGQRHTALTDALATAELILKLKYRWQHVEA